jgi:phosphoenolpyruvate carboxylase
MGLVACTEDAVYDRQYIGITEFIAPMVQAIKELSDKVKALEKVQ